MTQETGPSSGADDATLDTLAVPVLVWMPDGGVTFVNEAWCGVTGTTRTQNLGDGWLGAVHPQDRDTVSHVLARPGTSVLAYRLHRDGLAVPVLDTARAIARADGSIAAVVHTVVPRDMSAPQGQSVGRWAHELRGPLNAILGWADLLAAGEADPAILQKGLQVIASNARRQAAIIKRMAE
ncbi:MAG: PAS domain-containing protein [Acidobacteria bacterium]|nr:PAS domain-containing protein [Acidobacteriota bacterium]